MKFRRARLKDLAQVTEMAMFLWPNDREEQVAKAMKSSLSSPEHAVIVCEADGGTTAGFADISLRRDYVPGVTSFPVAYVEGIYVKGAYRRKGIGGGLIREAELWAIEKGCEQLASDTWVWNTLSQEFHTRAGFSETERVVFYVKRIDRSGVSKGKE